MKNERVEIAFVGFQLSRRLLAVESPLSYVAPSSKFPRPELFFFLSVALDVL